MNGQILINKNNLTHNLSEIQKYAKDSKIMSVIKSNGYGHGILEVASALKKSDAFAVATINEAIYLRNNNKFHRIHLFHVFFYIFYIFYL